MLSAVQATETECISEPKDLPLLKLQEDSEELKDALDQTWFIMALQTLSGNAALVCFKVVCGNNNYFMPFFG